MHFEKLNGKILLKRSPKYFYQIQGQLSQLKGANFDVYTGKNVPVYVETATFEENFQEHILTGIEFLFRWAVVPELLTPKGQRGEKLYQKGGWKKNFKKKKRKKEKRS